MKTNRFIGITTTGIVLAITGWFVFEHTGVMPQDVLSKNKGDIASNKIFGVKTIIHFQEPVSISAEDVVEITNKQRVAEGLTPLAIDEHLTTSAEMKVDDMITRQYFEHTSPTGEGVSDLGKEAGYDYVIMGENLALGDFENASDLVTAWMNSPGHRANILSTKYQDIGVSVKRASYQGKTVWFAVQHFGSARSVCPDIDQSLKSNIQTTNEELKKQEGEIVALKAMLQAPGASIEVTYQDEVARFNRMVDLYNQKLGASRALIDLYNGQVRAFNKCITTFQ